MQFADGNLSFRRNLLLRVSVCFLYRQRLVSDEAKTPLSAPYWPSKITPVRGLSFCGVFSYKEASEARREFIDSAR